MSVPPTITVMATDTTPDAWTPALNSYQSFMFATSIKPQADGIPNVTFVSKATIDSTQVSTTFPVKAQYPESLSLTECAMCTRFCTDADYFGIRLAGQQRVTLFCDDQLVAEDQIQNFANGAARCVISVKHNEPKKMRQYRLYTGEYLIGLYVGPTDVLVPGAESSIKIFAEADSYLNTNTRYFHNGIAGDFAAHLNADNVCTAIGGTGIIQQNLTAPLYTPLTLTRTNNIVTVICTSNQGLIKGALAMMIGAGTFTGTFRVLSNAADYSSFTFAQTGNNETGTTMGQFRFIYLNAKDETRISRVAAAYNGGTNVFLCMLGINDSSGDLAGASIQYFQAIKAIIPNALFIVVGPWCPVEANVATYKTSRMDPIFAGVRAANVNYILIDNLYGAFETSWGTTGTLGGRAFQTGAPALATGTTYAISSIVRTSNVVTVTCDAHTMIAGDKVLISTAGDFTGVWTIATTADSTHLTFAQNGINKTNPSYVNPTAQKVTTVGSDNMSIYSAGDGTHENELGATYLSYRLLNALHMAVKTYPF